MATTAVVTGIGGCLPARCVENAELDEALGTSGTWIRSRTGIERRRRVELGTGVSDLAVAAGRAALESAGTDAAGLVLLATSTPDRRCPATAPEVAWRLGLGESPAADLNAACSGFVYALAMAAAQISSDGQDSVLVIGADAYSTIVDPFDRNTAAIFGDGAGAVLLRRGEPGQTGALLASDWGSDGSGGDYAAVASGGSRMPHGTSTPERHQLFLNLNGRQLYLNAIRRMAASTRKVIERVGWSIDEVESLIAHQANQRILDELGRCLGLPGHRLISTIRETGNTSAASVPLAMVDAASREAIRPGGRTVLTAFGGGLTWGAIAMTWPAVRPLMCPPEARPPRSERAADSPPAVSTLARTR